MPLSVLDQARSYLSKMPSAISGSDGHGQTYCVAMTLLEGFGLTVSEARPLMQEYSVRCQPPWSEREIEHKLADADRKKEPGKMGKLLRQGVRWRLRGYSNPPPPPKAPAAHKAVAPAGHYEVPDTLELPEPMADGAREFLKAAFGPGEGIAIAVGRNNAEGKEIPKDAGVVLSREEWLRKLDTHKGNPNAFLKTSDRNGIFVRVNPMKLGGSKASDVTAWRHVLLEFDNISQVEQWGIIQASGVPCTAVLSSGNRSIHAWVKLDASSRDEYDERAKILYSHFEQYQPDNTKDPSRFSRLPGCERGKKRQELLALNIGKPSFADWLMDIQSDGIGEVMTVDDIDTYDPTADGSLLIGNDWLCRSESALLIGPSGVGKSSLAEQMIICWCVGRPFFGIKAVKPLKVLFIQAENTKRYLKKSLNGIREGLGIEPLTDEHELLRRNLIFVRDSTHTAHGFIDALKRLIDRHRPDLVVIDPLLSFLGGDINRVEVVSEFCRTWINPILESSNVAAIFVHHTGKPPTDPKSRKHWQIADFSYSGLGSSELTNWARAIASLQNCGQGTFQLIFSKRQMEHGATNPDGNPASSLWLRHGHGRICWDQIEPPDEPAAEPRQRKGGKPSKIDEALGQNLHSFLAGCQEKGEGKNEVAKRLSVWLSTKAETRIDLSDGSAKRAIEELVTRKMLAKNSDGLYVKGENA